MTSGSQKYVVGAPRGEKSRGGVVIVLGGATGPPCCAAAGPATIAPAPAASACTMVRRENALSSLSVSVTKPSRRNNDGRLIRHWGKPCAKLGRWQGTAGENGLGQPDQRIIITMAAAITTTIRLAMSAMCMGLPSMCRKILNRAPSGTRLIPHVGQR